jgi:Activator of Hsp90 ATPase homolog 1-like protein
MTHRPIEEPIRQAVTVPVPVGRAFATFTELARWWPPEYSWAADTLQDIGIEPREGGFCFERGPYGFTCHWGRVLVWDPPARFLFAWQIAPDRVPEPNPAKASEVEVRFLPADPTATRVEVEHRGFASHGDGGDAYRQALASPDGWPMLLDRFTASLS